ncbi:MAG: hypothetical protein AB1560_01950 [Pseudomonadota bacterium]
MVIYLPNEFIDPLENYLRRGMQTDVLVPSESEAQAIARLVAAIQHERREIPYQMYLSNKEERHVEDSVAGAGRVDARRAARRDGARKNHQKKSGRAVTADQNKNPLSPRGRGLVRGGK